MFDYSEQMGHVRETGCVGQESSHFHFRMNAVFQPTKRFEDGVEDGRIRLLGAGPLYFHLISKMGEGIERGRTLVKQAIGSGLARSGEYAAQQTSDEVIVAEGID